ncbi:hypothetical protein CQW23_22898 [Capsicum baccatum]|uniref:CCHC-type domain-containing protein n=1 Tax=Capsicum baccatum TaxID=33114 RepID=A0A2G2W272_CAPBA|nr:hypothetical protein CQW23_22898 [Capsicum baccatum]
MTLKRVFGYFKYTQDYALHYNKYPAVLEGYSDANWIIGSNEVKSPSGYVFTIGGGVVSWKSSKQTCIARSTMESEFIVLDKAGEEVEWLQNFLDDFWYCPKLVAPVCIHCDRQIKIDYGESKDNVLDPLIKGLSREGVEMASKGMGLRPRRSQHAEDNKANERRSKGNYTINGAHIVEDDQNNSKKRKNVEQGSNQPKKKFKQKCFNCGKIVYKSTDCRAPKKGKKKDQGILVNGGWILVPPGILVLLALQWNLNLSHWIKPVKKQNGSKISWMIFVLSQASGTNYGESKDNVLDPLIKGLSREGVEMTSKGMGLRPRRSQHGEVSLKECIIDAQLTEVPVVAKYHREDDSNNGRLYDLDKSHMEVNAQPLVQLLEAYMVEYRGVQCCEVVWLRGNEMSGSRVDYPGVSGRSKSSSIVGFGLKVIMRLRTTDTGGVSNPIS